MRDVTRNEAGFALVLALLSLLLLTFLGLTLATTTSTELQIANNYRWSEQARYNAESGLELAKRFLQQNTAWQILVPVARPAGGLTMTPGWAVNLPGPAGDAARNFENSDCDSEAAVGYGVVLYQPGFAYSFQNVSTYFGQSISGSFTLWARRPSEVLPDGTVQDYQRDDRLVLTAEGTAPYAYSAASASTYSASFRRRAVRTLEVELQKIDPSECENSFQGQAGLGALGSNYDPCSVVSAAGVINAVSEDPDTSR